MIRYLSERRELSHMKNQPEPLYRLSYRLGLRHVYDWSNSAMQEDIFIDRVLRHGCFHDIVRVAAFLGTDKVEAVSKSLPAILIEELRLQDMISNIKEGERRAKNI